MEVKSAGSKVGKLLGWHMVCRGLRQGTHFYISSRNSQHPRLQNFSIGIARFPQILSFLISGTLLMSQLLFFKLIPLLTWLKRAGVLNNTSEKELRIP